MKLKKALKYLGDNPDVYRYFYSDDGKLSPFDEAIESLSNYEPKADWKGWEDHVPRWKMEAKLAHEWLINYRDTKLRNNNV